jgi:hypothetical protein
MGQIQPAVDSTNEKMVKVVVTLKLAHRSSKCLSTEIDQSQTKTYQQEYFHD